MGNKQTRERYNKLATKWYRKFIKFEAKRSNIDIAYNQDKGLLLAILYTVFYYRDNRIGYPCWIDPDEGRTAVENLKLWDEELDQFISHIIYLVDHDQWDDEYRNKYDIVMTKLHEILPSLWM